MFGKDDFISILEQFNFDYEIDSEFPGLVSETGGFVSFEEIKLPSDYLKDLDNRQVSLTINSKKTATEVRRTYAFPELLMVGVTKSKDNIRMELAA